LTVLVDSNVLIDVVTDPPVWGAWSRETLERVAAVEMLVVNPIVYAEVSVGFDRMEDVETVFRAADFFREQLPYDAAFLAGKAFRSYRMRGGRSRSPLPDFYIGAHAAVAGYRLLTRDASRYRTYFPRLDIIAPPGA
jgi:predicted nucleic acid-binding protein